MKKDFFKDSKIKFPAYEPWISGDDKKIINKTLSQSMLTLGPQLEKFEADFCKYSKSKYAVAVSNCTAALHLSCLLYTSPSPRDTERSRMPSSA